MIFVTACTLPGDFISGSGGSFSSPNYPGTVDRIKTCHWNITVPEGFVIKITFHNFTLSPNEQTNCRDAQGARLRITNVASTDGNYPFELCGDQSVPQPLYSAGNSVLVRLTTGPNPLPGFNASYEAVSPDSCKLQYTCTYNM